MPEGIKTVAVEDGDRSPVEVLRTFCRAHLSASQQPRADAFVAELEKDIAANRRTDIECTALLSVLPDDCRAEANALVADLPVYLTQRRNRLLRAARDRELTRDDLDRLFRNVCLGSHAPLDPDLPKIAAQAIVHGSSQTALMARLTQALDRIRDDLATNSDDTGEGPDAAALRPLGRLIAFLRWVPHDWAEEIALDVIESVRPATRIDRLRLWVSVLRVFFARPAIGASALSRIVSGVADTFGWPAPMELRELIRAILVKGGNASERLLLRLLESNSESERDRFFLDVLAVIDKPTTARWLTAHADAVMAANGMDTYLRLLTATGERSPRVANLLTSLWEHGQRETRLRCLDTVQELHFAEMASFVVSRLEAEHDATLRYRIVETVAAAAGADDLRILAARVRRDRSALRYYAMHLVHRRLMDTPALLAMQDDFVLLYNLQTARANLYSTYCALVQFRTLLADGDARREAATWRETVSKAVALCRDRDLLSRRVRTGIFGRTTHHRTTEDLLGDDDLTSLDGTAALTAQQLADLLTRTDHAIAFLRQTFLWQEWFLREIPFVLSESMENTIERIHDGTPIPFHTGRFSDPAQRAHLRKAFGIFCESTRQGLYLTDALLAHIENFPREDWPDIIRDDLTRRRVMVADGRLVYHPADPLARHLQFTTFAHDYRYGKESLEKPSLLQLWLRYTEESRRIEHALEGGPWPPLERHPRVPEVVGPRLAAMYDQHAAEAEAVHALVVAIHQRADAEHVRLRVIPNLTHGLFCLAPVVERVVQRGIHVSLAGISSQFCDDENISRFSLRDENAFPLKRYVFSHASNYGTLNSDRVLVVVDGTMEPIDRHDTDSIRLPKAYRGYVNHLAAINYIRARYAYKMNDPERDVASALNLPLRFVRNLVRTHEFRHLLASLLLTFDAEQLARSHAVAGTGKTYYSFAQWNPDGMAAHVGPIGYTKHEMPCATVEHLPTPCLLFVSMNSIFNDVGVAGFFDNNPEVEHPRMFIGPQGVLMDNGWPQSRLGIQVSPHA